ncbi:MAG: hypothetical protein OEM64_00490 [Gammaproteobacteria bacterium]|nr:hypothetical protein [Gammaproteobacteria bacterium]MDH3414763.1 hypothetical protein [Gammaproteobacteria bacterium]
MKHLIRRYLNEIVGLTMMALMTIALVAAQAEATTQEAAAKSAADVIEIHVSFKG